MGSLTHTKYTPPDMQTLPSFLKSQLLGASLLALTVATAHAGSKSVTYPVAVGNDQIGSKATYGVTAQNGTTLASFATTAASSGNLIGNSGTLVSLSVTDSYNNGVAAINSSFIVGNYTVSSTTGAASIRTNATVSQTFFSATSTLPVTVGAVTYPVSLKGTLAGGATINLTASANTSAKSVTVSGTVSNNAAGTVTASLPASSGAAASVTSSLNFGNSTVSTNSTISTTAMSGSTNLAVDAQNLSLIVLINSIKTNASIAKVNLANFVVSARTVLLLGL